MLKLTSRWLNRSEQEAIIQSKLKWILEECRPLEVLLFGSAARGEMKESSDIDLMLVFADSVSLRMARDRLNQTRKKDDWPQDLVFHTVESFARSVATGGGAAWLARREGKTLYDAHGGDKR